MKRTADERHKKRAYGNLNDMFDPHGGLSQSEEKIYVNTQ